MTWLWQVMGISRIYWCIIPKELCRELELMNSFIACEIFIELYTASWQRSLWHWYITQWYTRLNRQLLSSTSDSNPQLKSQSCSNTSRLRQGRVQVGPSAPLIIMILSLSMPCHWQLLLYSFLSKRNSSCRPYVGGGKSFPLIHPVST